VIHSFVKPPTAKFVGRTCMREFPGRGGLMYLFSDQHLFIDVDLPKDVSQQLLS